MDKISTRDIKSFGKVLEAIGKLLQEKPENLEKLFESLKLLNSNEQTDTIMPNSGRTETLNIFDIAKNTTKDDFRTMLLGYNLDELKVILKKFRLGGLKLKSKDSIIDHIIEQTTKRTTDVFRDYDINNSNLNNNL